jgi:hypothetical protein
MESARQQSVVNFLFDRPQGATGSALGHIFGLDQVALDAVVASGEIDVVNDRYFHPDHVHVDTRPIGIATGRPNKPSPEALVLVGRPLHQSKNWKAVDEVFKRFPDRNLSRKDIIGHVGFKIAKRTLGNILQCMVELDQIHRVHLGAYRTGPGVNAPLPFRPERPRLVVDKETVETTPVPKETVASPNWAPEQVDVVPTMDLVRTVTLPLVNSLLDVLNTPAMDLPGLSIEQRLNLRLAYALGARENT